MCDRTNDSILQQQMSVDKQHRVVHFGTVQPDCVYLLLPTGTANVEPHSLAVDISWEACRVVKRNTSGYVKTRFLLRSRAKKQGFVEKDIL